jgi:hypothetical protein
MAVSYQNDIHEDLESKVNSGDICYNLVQNLLSSPLSKNAIFKIKENNNFLQVLSYDRQCENGDYIERFGEGRCLHHQG